MARRDNDSIWRARINKYGGYLMPEKSTIGGVIRPFADIEEGGNA